MVGNDHLNKNQHFPTNKEARNVSGIVFNVFMNIVDKFIW